MSRTSAVRAPATRDQADAYRFGLRRLEAALVRGDPVPLHEQIRTQRRAALGGVALGLLGLCAAALYAVLAPSPDWRNHAVVTGSQSGALYVVTPSPHRLVPVANLPAARLVLAAIGRGADAPAATAEEVPDADLAAAPRTPTAALTGAVGVRPEMAIAPGWALCEETTPEGGFAATTVIGGAAATAPVAATDAVLVSAPDDATWLVVNGRRHRVDVGDGAVLAGYGLSRVVPRAASDALVALLPEGPELATPVVRNRGDDAPDGLPGRVGDVLMSRPVGGGSEYFVVLSGGVQPVPDVVAELLRVASGERAPREVGPEVLAGARFRDELNLDGWPPAAANLRDPADTPVVCWTWTPAEPTGRIWMGAALPVPGGTTPVVLAQADGAGAAVDAVAVGQGGAVRATGDREQALPEAPDAGPDGQVWLVSETGVGYPVADDPTASALGVASAEPAPVELLELLPGGPPLDLEAAASVVDVLR